jgi:hypothetical protein
MLLVLSVTVPVISLTEALPYVKIEQLALPFILAVYPWLLLTGHARPVRFNAMMVVAAAFSVAILLSMWYGSAILGHTILWRDFYELPLAWLPVIFFTLAYEIDWTESALRRLVSAFALAVLLICCYGWAQFAGLNFTYLVNPHYSAGPHIDRGLQFAHRIYSTMGNPNVLGQLMTWAVALFFMAAVFHVGSFARNAFLVFSCLITAALTGSRFALLAVALVFLLILFLPVSSFRRRSLQIGVFFLLLPLSIWTLQAIATIDRPAAARYGALRHPLEVDSFRARVDDLWRDAADNFVQSPILGHGPAKEIFGSTVTDSEYWDILKEFGIVGFVCYLGFYLSPLFLIWKGLRASRFATSTAEDHLRATFLVVRLGFVMVLTALVMNVAMTTFHNHLLQAFLWMWLGIAASCSRTIQRSVHLGPVAAFER